MNAATIEEEALALPLQERAKLVALVLMYKNKAAYNDGLASRYQAAKTRLAKFEEAGPPQEVAREQSVRMRLTGGRTGKRAVICEQLGLTGKALRWRYDQRLVSRELARFHHDDVLMPLADEAKRRGVKVYHLNIGQPDIETPDAMRRR